MSKNKELAKDYFERHPQSDECHITSDGRVFHESGAAQGYATALKESKVEKFTREGKVNEIPVDAETVEPITLADFNPETTSYEAAKALVKELGIETASNKKADVFAALTEAQSKITE